jgi:hypothetical protein
MALITDEEKQKVSDEKYDGSKLKAQEEDQLVDISGCEDGHHSHSQKDSRSAVEECTPPQLSPTAVINKMMQNYICCWSMIPRRFSK